MKKMIETLKSTYLFESIEEKTLLDIAKFSVIKEFASEEIIIKEDAVDSYDFYVLLHGKVEVYANTIEQTNNGFAEDDEITYSIQNKSIFGEMACIVKKRRSASVKASINTEVIEINGIKFMEYLENNKEFGFKILSRFVTILVDKLNDTNFKLRNHYLF